jgi:hypothetical protein
MRSQTTRVITGRVNSDGTIALPGPYTARRTASGDYTVTTTDRLLGATVTEAGTSAYMANASNFIGNTFRVVTQTASTGTGTDRPFSFVAVVAA